MSRAALSSTDKIQATSAIAGLVAFLSIALPSGTLYLTDADRPYTWSGNTYSPSNGQWGGVTNYNETADSVPRPMSIRLSGVDATLIGNIEGNNIQGVAITWSLGFTDSNGVLLDTPSMQMSALLGDCTINVDRNSGIISISGENLLADIQNRNSNLLQTQADQENRFSGDTFFQEIAGVINKIIYWGQLGPSYLGTIGTVSGAGGGKGGGTGSQPKQF